MLRLYTLTLVVFFMGINEVLSQASASANFTASATIVQPIGIATTSNLQFANIDAKNGGVVVLTPESTRIANGKLELVEGGAISAATLIVTGQTGFAFSISLPRGSYRLTSDGESMLIQDFTTNYDGSSITDNGKTIKVGASLIVNPDQKPGDYITVDNLQVTVNYN